MQRLTLALGFVFLLAGGAVSARAADSETSDEWGSTVDSDTSDDSEASEDSSNDDETQEPSESSADSDGERTQKSSEGSADAEDEQTEESSEDSADADSDQTQASASTDSSQGSMSLVETPAAYTFGLGLNPGVLFWDTPYGGQESTFTVMATGHARVSAPLIASLSIRYARRAPTAGTLVVANDHISAMGGFGAEGWLETLRLSIQAQGGVISRRLTISDGTGTTYRANRFAPTAGGRFSVGASFGETFLLSLVSGFRYFAPKRGEFYTGLEAGWLFVHSP